MNDVMKSCVVLKFGSGILSEADGVNPDVAQFRRLCAETAALVAGGVRCVLVSSGAVAAGLAPMGLSARPRELTLKQACAAVGQSRLMHTYADCFAPHGLVPAQILLTHGDLDSRMRQRNARNTLRHLLDHPGIVPVINENDTVAVEELRFGDNDRLSAEVAILCQASRLILLTGSDGLLDADGRTVREVRDVEQAMAWVREETGRLSVGGMRSKLESVRLALEAGIPCHIASGRTPGQVAAIMRGEDAGTRFVPAGGVR